MDSKTQKIVLALIVVVAALLGLMGGLLYVQHSRNQVVDVSAWNDNNAQTVPPNASIDANVWETPPVELPAEPAEEPSMGANGEELTEMPDDDGAVETMPDDGSDDANDGSGNSDEGAFSDSRSDSIADAVSPAQNKASSQELQKLKKELHKAQLETYRDLAKHPEKLGFTPNEELFKCVYMRIRSSYVDNVSDEKLYDGVVEEIGVLLEALGQPRQGLKTLDPDKNALSQLDALYGKCVDKKVLIYAAIQGMLGGLGDPYSVLMTPEELSGLEEQVQSKGYGGVGIIIELDKDANNMVTVFEAMEDTPAYKAGLEAGDQLLSIDGQDTKGMTLDKASRLIRGPIGSEVKFKVSRAGKAQPFQVTVRRAMVHVTTVSRKMLGDKIAYLRLRQFGKQTAAEFEKELQKAKDAGMKGLILDLRNNGGGYVDAAVKLVGEFIPKGGVVVYTEGRTEKHCDYTTKTAPKVKVPVVVLINRYSASASEITAGALRDHHIAKLIGENSFGKGSVQQLFDNGDGSALKLTIAHFFSPNGVKINHQGIKPDVEIKMQPNLVGKVGRDTQLERALKSLSAK